jgi:hypothetical protein
MLHKLLLVGVIAAVGALSGCGGGTAVPTKEQAAQTPTVAAPKGENATVSAPAPVGGAKISITPSGK